MTVHNDSNLTSFKTPLETENSVQIWLAEGGYQVRLLRLWMGTGYFAVLAKGSTCAMIYGIDSSWFRRPVVSHETLGNGASFALVFDRPYNPRWTAKFATSSTQLRE